jgi:hypothetical protein
MTMMIRLKGEVTPTHQLVVELPPDIPVGEVEVIITSKKADEIRESGWEFLAHTADIRFSPDDLALMKAAIEEAFEQVEDDEPDIFA